MSEYHSLSSQLTQVSASLTPITGSQLESLSGALPSDYLEFLKDFGPGLLNEFFEFRNPFTVVSETTSVLNTWKQFEDDLLNDPSWPDNLFTTLKCTWADLRERLLMFALTTNGDYMFFDRRGPNPSQWPIVVTGSWPAKSEVFLGSFAAFVLALSKGMFSSRIFPDDYAERNSYRGIPAATSHNSM